MTPDEIAARHPKLYHVTEAGSWPTIETYGLLSTELLLALFDVPAIDRERLMTRRRPEAVTLSHPVHGQATINDNAPLHEAKLANCLDDGLIPPEWLRILNSRVFFWTEEKRLSGLLAASGNAKRHKTVLVLDTRKLASACLASAEITPINTGATLRKPARRGLATFAPVASLDFAKWQKQRGLKGRDTIVEFVVRDAVPDAARYVIDVI